jgi:hypothetical protein
MTQTGNDTHRQRSVGVRKSTETKAAFKTTEFMAYLACVVAIAIMSLVVGDDTNANGGGNDYFLADDAMLLITIVTVGYLLSRGLAKSGSREPYDATVDLDRR